MAGLRSGILASFFEPSLGRVVWRGLSLLLAAQLPLLGIPVVATAQQPPPPPTLLQVWANAHQVGFNDAGSCVQEIILHGCPQPVGRPITSQLAAANQKCFEDYRAGYQAGENAPGTIRQNVIDDAKRQARADAQGCIRMRNASVGPCSDEWEEVYRAAYGLQEERCKGKWKDARNPGSGATETPPAPPPGPAASGSPSVAPPPPAAPADESEAAAASEDSGFGWFLPLLGIAALGAGAYELGVALKNSSSSSSGGSCSSWASSNCPSTPGQGFETSNGLCHCCVPICGGGSSGCSCLACSSCSGGGEECIGGTCCFSAGGSP